MSKQRAIRLGDIVRRRSDIYSVGKVVRMIRGDWAFYRRAEVRKDDGSTFIAAVADLAIEPKPEPVE